MTPEVEVTITGVASIAAVCSALCAFWQYREARNQRLEGPKLRRLRPTSINIVRWKRNSER